MNAVDKFIIFDDVDYIKGGWINRNRILINNQQYYFTISLSKASQNKKINEINIKCDNHYLLNMIYYAYKKDEFYKQAIKLIFIKPNEIIYKQFDNEFIPNLSIIDVMMFNSLEQIKEILD